MEKKREFQRFWWLVGGQLLKDLGRGLVSRKIWRFVGELLGVMGGEVGKGRVAGMG